MTSNMWIVDKDRVGCMFEFVTSSYYGCQYQDTVSVYIYNCWVSDPIEVTSIWGSKDIIGGRRPYICSC